MALFKLGSTVTECRGKLGGSAFQMNAGRCFAFNKSTPRPSPSVLQIQSRSAIEYFSRRWKSLTAVQRTAWNLFANKQQRFESGRVVPWLTGFQLFVRINLLYQNPNVVTQVSPPSFTAASLATFTDFTINSLGTQIGVKPNRIWTNPEYVLVYASHRILNSQKYYNGGFRYIGALNAASLAVIGIQGNYNLMFTLKPVLGSYLIIRYFYLNLTTGTAGHVYTMRSRNI